jgi:hypothetical protein
MGPPLPEKKTTDLFVVLNYWIIIQKVVVFSYFKIYPNSNFILIVNWFSDCNSGENWDCNHGHESWKDVWTFFIYKGKE